MTSTPQQGTLDMELKLHTTGWSGQKVDVCHLPVDNSCKPLSVQLLLEMSSTTSNLVSTIAEKYVLVLRQLLLSSLYQNRP